MAALLAIAMFSGIAIYIARASDLAERRRRKLRVTIAALSTVSIVALMEGPAILGWIDYRVPFQTDGVSTLYNPRYQLDRKLIGIHFPNEEFRGSFAGDLVHRLQIPTDRRYDVDVRWDRNGFRNEGEVEHADVVLIGDSFLEAVLVPWKKTVTSRLSQTLGRPVLNLGHGGYGPQQELEVLRRFGFAASPKIVVWFFYEGNDLANFENYETIQSDWDRWVAREHGFLRRSLVRNAAVALKQIGTRDRDYPSLAAARSGVLECPGTDRGESMYFGYRCEPLTARDTQALVGSRRILATAADECRVRGARLVLAFVPVKWRVYRSLVRDEPGTELSAWRASDLNETLAAGLPSDGVDYVDLTAPLEAAASKGELVYFLDDAHWTSRGHEVVAQAVCQQVERHLASRAD